MRKTAKQAYISPQLAVHKVKMEAIIMATSVEGDHKDATENATIYGEETGVSGGMTSDNNGWQ